MTMTTVPTDQSRSRASTGVSDIGLWPYATIVVQLVLVLVLLRQFQIEGKAFVELAALSFFGFAVHALLPLAWRLPFFTALSLAALAYILGWANAGWIIAIGAVLLGACHLPMPTGRRAAVLVGLAAVLMAQRAGLLPVPWSPAIWPILGAMFMFRLIVYFYDLKTEKTRPSALQSVSYFAMLPNVCFPLFPVIDFKTYRRSHYALPAHDTYQRGVDWIVRGVVHLILYRVVYLYLTLAPSEVATPSDLLQYLAANFLVYLRVSGSFHVIIGLLHLFGFSLPETHNRYLLATSLTDHWRRINIYWKDFMQKVFYYPAVFAFKRFGPTHAIVYATLWVFLLTWFFHSYQWFWLRGNWLLTPQDFLFWAFLGFLVVLNSLYELKFGRTRSLGKPAGWTARAAAVQVAKAFGMFWLMCFLWSFWGAESISGWLSLWQSLSGPYTWKVLIFPAVVLVVITLGFLPYEKFESAGRGDARQRLMRRDRNITVVVLVALLGLSVETLHTRLGSEVASVVHSLRSPQLSRHDAAKMERGYYENLMDVGSFNSQLWEVFSKRPANWLAVDFTGLKQFTPGFEQYVLKPSLVSSSQYGAISMNRYGMRDQDYPPQRPPGTLRIAVLGASSVMGWGVGDGASFEALLEQRLAREPAATGFDRVELLNFGVPGYQPPQQLVNLERALKLQPNSIFFVATGREPSRSVEYLAEAFRKGLAIPYPELQALVAEAGLQPGMTETEMTRRLQPMADRVLGAVYRRLAERCRAMGVAPVWVYTPQLQDGPWHLETPRAQAAAEAAGFAIVNLHDVYRGHPVETTRLEAWDEHPNAFAHRLLADRLHAEMTRRGAALFNGASR